MGWVFARPSLTAIEVGWHLLFGLPFLAVCWVEAQRILALLPLDSTGLSEIDAQNPWVAVVQITDAWAHYQPHVMALLLWLLPLAAMVWVVISGLGRSLLLKKMEPRLSFRPLQMMALQGSMAFGAGRNLLGVVPLHRVGSGNTHSLCR